MDGLAERLVKLRKERLPGVSCRTASELAGLGSCTLRRYERGIREPGASELKSIAELYGVSIDYICGISKKNSENLQFESKRHHQGKKM